MPQQPTAPPAVRFFARLDKFHCECPACGTLIVANLDRPRGHARDQLQRKQETAVGRNPALPYNPYSSRLRCPGCETIFGVGLLLWPIRKGARAGQPADCKPTRRQLAQLRAYAGGWWAEQLKGGADEVNVAVVAECTCPPPDGWAPACPIHGSDLVRRSSGEPIEGE